MQAGFNTRNLNNMGLRPKAIGLARKAIIFLSVGSGMSLAILGGIYLASWLHGVPGERLLPAGSRMFLSGIALWAVASAATFGWNRSALSFYVEISLVNLSWIASLYLIFAALSGELLRPDSGVAVATLALWAAVHFWHRRARPLVEQHRS